MANSTDRVHADSHDSGSLDPKTKGEISESVCRTALIRRGLTVLEPTSEHVRYDFVIDEGGDFVRVQCKTARKVDGALSFSVRSNIHNNTGSKRPDYHGDVDAFVVYSPDTERVYWVDIDEVGSTAKRLRLEPPKNNQTERVSMAEDYRLDAVVGPVQF